MISNRKAELFMLLKRGTFHFALTRLDLKSQRCASIFVSKKMLMNLEDFNVD